MPPRGGPQDRVLELVHRREREERFTVVSLFAKIVGSGLGVSDSVLEAMLSTYKLELTQAKYTPEYAVFQRQKKKQAVAKQQKKKSSDDALMKRLDSYAEPEEQTSPQKRGTRKR